MKTIRALRFPLVVLVVLLGLSAISIFGFRGSLPERVASHFDFQGVADGWMTRDQYVLTMGATALLMPLFMLAIGLSFQVLPAESMNLPHREYWLSPDRKAETALYMTKWMAWLSCIVVALTLALHWLVVRANHADPVRLSNEIWILVAAFLGSVVCWLVNLIRHFSRLPHGAD